MSLSKRIGLFAGPIVFVLLLMMGPPEGLESDAWKVIATAVFMLIWWVTEAVPIPVAALLPLVCFPFLAVSTTKEAAAPYGSDMVFLFMGGFMLALAMERWSLHRRIALSIVKITGTSANGILFGFMLATLLLSMWISNTATTVLMLPIAMSVIHLITKQSSGQEKGLKRFALTMMLGIAYSANVGGTATIIGTPPNVVLVGMLKETYGYEMSFATWLILGVPFAFIMLGFIYVMLVYVLFPNRLGKFESAKALLDRELDALGPMGKAERRVLIVFVFTALSWILRGQLEDWFPFMIIKDAGIAMLAAVLLFVVPTDFKKGEFLLDWKNTEKLPWGILLLFGGGLSLAAALNKTGLIQIIGEQFVGAEWALFSLIFLLSLVSLFLTEIMSNLALVTIFLPVVGGIAVGAELNPLILCIPVTLASSCAFMLPMSTPPNAIVFASGYLKVAQMVRAGVFLNVLAIILITLLTYYFVGPIFNL